MAAPPLTKAQRIATYILLSTDSEMRRYIEGIIDDTYPAVSTLKPPASQTDIDTRLDIQLKRVFNNGSLDHTSLKDSTMLSPASANELQRNKVTFNPKRLRTAVGMDAIYDGGGDPCPSDFSNASGSLVQVNDQAKLVAIIVGPFA
jgi:hypothetical protein